MSDGNSVNAVDSFAGVFEGFVDDWINGFNMGTGGDFWDDAAVFGMDVDLGYDNIR